MLNAIGPVWDGNEVWLVTGGGALFAAFPNVYATVFSGFYLAFVLLLVALIFRAVAIEFRSKQPMRWWRQMWDIGFSAGSILSSLLIGVAMGNIAWGIPIDDRGEFAGTFWSLLHPYALLLGVTTVALFMMHGAIYALMKTEGPLHDKLRGWINHCIIFFIICYAVTTMATLLYVPHMAARVRANPWLFSIALANMLAIANIPREIHRGRDWRAFLSSCAAMITPDGALRPGDVSQPGAEQPESGPQPDHLQCRLLAQDPGHHADHRGDRRARRAGLHGEHLLDLPRQSEARPDELLIAPTALACGRTCIRPGRQRTYSRRGPAG